MTDIIERLKKTNYKKWFIFAHEGMHALKQMEKRNLNIKDVKRIIKKGELLPDVDPGIVLCVGKKDRIFFTLVLKPLFKNKAFVLITPKPSNKYEKRRYKEMKRNKKRV